MDLEYPALLDQGFHAMTLEELGDVCVNGFQNNEHRRELWSRFERFLRRLRSTGLDYELWVNGSFLTQKREPADIDVVVFYDPQAVNSLGDSEKATIRHLFEQPRVTKLRYRTHAFFAPKIDAKALSYWQRWFGRDRSNNPKGIVKLTIGSP